MRSKTRAPTGNRDSGAVAVETAGVSMLLIILLFGIIDSSFLFKDWISVSAAARAGVRMGTSQPRSPSFAQDSANQVTNALSDLTAANIQEVWVYKATHVNDVPPANFTDRGSFADCTVCVKFTWDAGTKSLKPLSDNWPYTSQNACAGDSARDSLGVYVKYKHSSPVGFFFNNATVSEATVMWIEPTSAAICKP
jgi:TadE-like protein